MEERETPRARVPRPVGDAPATLFALAPAIAKGWLLELLDAVPLEDVPDVPTTALAAEAPALCAAVVRALGSDSELDALIGADPGSSALRVVELVGAADAGALLRAIESLRAVTWAAIQDELPRAQSSTALDLADRLAHVTGLLAEANLPALVHRAPGAVMPAVAPIRAERATTNGDGVVALWRDALERRLADGGRFSLLLVELDGAEPLRLADPEGFNPTLDRVAQAVRQALRRADLMAHEQAGRTWVIAAEAGRRAATSLAARIAGEVADSGPVHGAPLAVSVGIAVHPDDGPNADELVAQAEEAVFVARAAGVRVGGGTAYPMAGHRAEDSDIPHGGAQAPHGGAQAPHGRAQAPHGGAEPGGTGESWPGPRVVS